MRKLKLFLSLLMLMAFSVGNVWGVDYQLVTSTDDLVVGANYVIGTSDGSFIATTTNNNNRKMTSGTITNNVVTATDAMMVFTLGGTSSGWTLYAGNYASGAGYLNATNTTGSNYVKIVEELDQYAYFTIAITDAGVATITCTGKTSRNILYKNGTTCFSCYNNQTQSQYVKPGLYKEVSSSCSNTVTITKGAETNGTYTLSATEICGDGEGEDVTISDITPDPGYAFDKITTSASGTVDNVNKKVTGITANTTITVLFKELQKYTVSFNSGAGNPAVSPITEATAGAGITLPAGPTPACSADGWVFAGWAAAAVAAETTSAPTLLSGKYNPTDNVTLYAVYKRTEGGDGAAVGTTLFSEDFGTFSANDVPNGETSATTGRVIYGGGSVTYTSADNGSNLTKIYNDALAGGTAPELLVGKSGGVFTIAGIPSGKADKISVSFKQNAQKLTVSLTGEGYSTTYASPKPSVAGEVSFDIDVADGADETFAMVLTAGSSNVRLDDISITVKTTSAAGTTYYLSAPSCCTKHNIELVLGVQHGSISADLTEACEGTEVTLTATPDEHCRFVKWEVKQGETPVAVSDNKFTMPAGDVTVSATFAEIKNAVTFAAPTGGTLSIMNGEDPVSTDTEIVEGTALTVTATPDAENHYIGGAIKVVKTSDESDVTASVLDGSTLTMPNYAITVSATFTPTYAINLVAEGGSIALEYTKGGAADGYALAGTEIMATATADDAHVFASLALSENVTIKDIDANVAMFTMPDEAVTITATFDAKSTPTISVSTDAIAFDPVDYNGELTAQTFKVSGVALVAGKLTITSNNEAFSVSPAEIDVDGALDDTEITVTPKTTACGTFNATITISGGNAAAKEVSVSLTVNKLASNLAWSAAEATVTIDANDNVFPTLTNPRNLPVVYSSLYDEVASIDENGAVTLKKAGETMIIVNFAGNDTVTALAEDALYYTLTVQQKYTVEWYINGAKKGEQTALAGVALESIPDATSIENGAIAGKVFRGWATAAIEGEVDEAQAGIVATPTVIPGADTKYYAVYATEEGDAEPALSQTLSYDTWTYSGTTTDKSTYRLFGSDSQIESAEFDLTTLVQVDVYAGTFGTLSNKTVKITDGTNTWGTFTMSTKSHETKNEVTSEVALTGTGKIYVIPNDGDGSGSGARISKVEIYTQKPISYSKYATSGPRKLANPTFGLEEGVYTEAQSVTIIAGDGEAIYYTLDGTEPTVENGRIYGDPIALKNYGSYTIKAIAAKEDGSKSDVVSATYGINIPFETVSALFDYIETGKPFLGDISVTGVVSEIVTAYSTEHSNISFNISDDGQTTSNQFQSFRGVGTEASAITVGDQVTITGTYTLYGSIHELTQGNVISNRVAAEVSSVVISGTATKTEYFYNDDFSFAGLVATANYNTGYTKVVTEEANVWAADPAQVTATGNVNVTATYGGKTSEAKVVAVTKKLRQLDFADLYWSSYDRENILLGYSETPAVRSVINKYNLPVTYRSGNGSVMSVNAETGVITAKAPGFASMFVEFAGNEEYASHNASYPVAVFGYDHIELSGEATKTAYEKGDAFDFTGLVATAVYTLGEQTPQQLDVTDQAEWSADPAAIDKTTAKVTATASWKEKSASTDVDVTVNKHTITIEAPENGSLTVTDELPISSGAKFFKGDVLTVEATPASADYKSGVVTVTGATLEGNTFTVGTSDITVSAVFAEKAAAEIGWSSSAPEVVLFGYSEAPAQRAVSNPNELSISYRSSNTDAVTVNAETGEIAVVGTGSASIFVEFAGNADYKAVSDSYTIEVYGFDHIEVSGEAAKTAYEKGDAFEYAGLVATAVYTLGEQTPQQLVVTDLAEWSAEPATIGSNTAKVTATASWKEKNVSQEVDVTVNKHTITIEAPENGSLAVVNELPVSSGEKFYKGDQLTVTATPASADYKAGVITVTGATLEGNTITVGTTDFTVSAVFAEKAEAGIEWSNTYGEIQLQGTEIVDSDLPSLTNPYELTITYSSDNTDVAEIDPATGVITPKAEGYTTISATFAGNEVYSAAQVSFNLTVEVVAQPEFYLIGSFNDWKEFVPVYDTWYRFENLTSGDYQLKVTTAPNWSEAYGYDELTIKHAGLSKDNDGNICFTIPNESFVDIDFEKDEEGVKTFTVTGGYVKPTFTVVGVEALVGYNWGDGLNAFENEMAEDPSTGNYELEKEDVMLAAGDYEYQVAMNHDWRGVSNSTLTITESGIYTVTFTFDPSTGATSAVADLQEAIVVIPTVAVKGTWNEWAASTTLTPAENKETASVTIELAAGSYEFGMEINSNWTANGSAFTRDANSKAVSGSTGNMTIVADVAGEYTFTWTFDGNLLSIAYPELPEPEYYIAGEFTDWETNKVKMTEDNSALVATVSISSTDEQAFKVLRVQGPYETWYGLENYAKMSSDDCTNWTIGGGESNIGLEPTKAGEYTFVFVPAELKLTVNMPAKGSGTALDNTEADTKAVKTMENGVLIIRRGDKTYNGQGQLLR